MRALPLLLVLAVLAAVLATSVTAQAQVPTLITIEVPLNATGIHPSIVNFRLACEARSSAAVVAAKNHDIAVPETREIVETVAVPLDPVSGRDPASATTWSCRVWLCTSSTSCVPSTASGGPSSAYRDGTTTIVVGGNSTAGVSGTLSF